jgi:hypothetical protein
MGQQAKSPPSHHPVSPSAVFSALPNGPISLHRSSDSTKRSKRHAAVATRYGAGSKFVHKSTPTKHPSSPPPTPSPDAQNPEPQPTYAPLCQSPPTPHRFTAAGSILPSTGDHDAVVVDRRSRLDQRGETIWSVVLERGPGHRLHRHRRRHPPRHPP